MGAQKVRWTEDEEAALKKGVDKHGVGRWKYIKLDEEFKDILENRSNGEDLDLLPFPRPRGAWILLTLPAFPSLFAQSGS